MIDPKKNLLESFKQEPLVLELLAKGDTKKVAKLATAMGTAGGSPELRKYGKELWNASQK